MKSKLVIWYQYFRIVICVTLLATFDYIMNNHLCIYEIWNKIWQRAFVFLICISWIFRLLRFFYIVCFFFISVDIILIFSCIKTCIYIYYLSNIQFIKFYRSFTTYRITFLLIFNNLFILSSTMTHSNIYLCKIMYSLSYIYPFCINNLLCTHLKFWKRVRFPEDLYITVFILCIDKF